MSQPPPESKTEEFALSEEQRSKLLGFIERFDKAFSDGSFEKEHAWSDVELLALGLRVAELLGFEGEALERLFCDEFNVEGIGEEGVLSTALSIAMMVDAEQRLLCACGGKN